MDHRLMAAFGGILIGLVASAVVYVMTMRRVTNDLDRPWARSWTLAFTLSLCTFTGVLPLLDPSYAWIVVLPLLGSSLALCTLHRIGADRAEGVQ